MIYDHTALKEAKARGSEIQFNDPDDGWLNITNPLWSEHCEYRIKPSQEVLQKEQDAHSNLSRQCDRELSLPLVGPPPRRITEGVKIHEPATLTLREEANEYTNDRQHGSMAVRDICYMRRMLENICDRLDRNI